MIASEVGLQEQQQGFVGCVSSGWHIQSTSNVYAVEVADLCDTTVDGRAGYGRGYSYGSEGLVCCPQRNVEISFG